MAVLALPGGIEPVVKKGNAWLESGSLHTKLGRREPDAKITMTLAAAVFVVGSMAIANAQSRGASSVLNAKAQNATIIHVRCVEIHGTGCIPKNAFRCLRNVDRCRTKCIADGMSKFGGPPDDLGSVSRACVKLCPNKC